MAFLIPENTRNNKAIPKPHRRVATALVVGLDDATTVWFEPPFDAAHERPDFVVLDPSAGVLVVMVFDQSEGQEVLGAVGGELRVLEAGSERTVNEPLARANAFGHALADSMTEAKGVSEVPIGGIAAFPYVSRAEAEHLCVDTVVAPEHSLFKEDIDVLVRGEDDAMLTRVVTRVLEGGLDEPLGEDQQDRIRALLHPEVVIAAQPEQPSLFVARSPDRNEVFRVMDRRQEAFAKGLGSGHRVIRGVAGSGKTLILVYRARLLAKLFPSEPILVTCYTKALASVLQAQLAQCPNVEVTNIDSLMSRAIRSAGLEHPGYGHDAEAVSTLAVRAHELRPPETYRAVMVDEAQDLDTDALRFCAELARVDSRGDSELLVVADSAQNIFRRQFNWSDAGIKAQGRTSILRKNYRNTREILAFAHEFLTADGAITTEEVPDLEDALTIITADAAERSGPRPALEVVPDIDAEIERVVSEVVRRYSPDLAARSIAVLMTDHSHCDRGERVVDGLRSHDLPVFWVTDPSERDNKSRTGIVDEPIVVSTVHSAKGLEFDTVIMCGFGRMDRSDAQRLLAERRTVYVGFTRALDELVVVTTADNAFVEDLPQIV